MSIELDEFGRRIFEPDGATLAAYLADRAPVSVIQGPVGSGTSSTSCYKLTMLMCETPKSFDGKRRSKWFVVRNTYSQLHDTTLATWLYWFPERLYGRLVRSRPMVHQMRWADVEADVYFLALDNEDDIEKLRSFEFTGGWFNELEFVMKPIFDEAHSRCRYPSRAEIGDQDCWRGVIADLNAPPEDHWLPQMRGLVPYPDDVPDDKRFTWSKSWSYLLQPPALIEEFDVTGKKIVGYHINPEAENLKNLPENYYLDIIVGKSKDWIDSRVMNRIVTVVDGDPVWRMFSRASHTTDELIPFNPNYPVYVSLDFGNRPTALIAQEINNRVLVQRELRDFGVGAATFAPALKKFLTQNYPGATLKFTGDPKGQDKTQAGERTAYEIFRAHGMPITPSPVRANAIQPRLEVVAYALQYSPNGNSRILISAPGCPTLVPGMAGKYHLAKTDVGEALPVKDKWSDPCDCLGYLLIYLGDGREMIGLTAASRGKVIHPKKQRFSMRRIPA